METNADYTIRRSVLFDNGSGFALGENPDAPAPYVTWRFNDEKGRRNYYWGHYHNTKEDALNDFGIRVAEYMQSHEFKELGQNKDALPKAQKSDKRIPASDKLTR